MPNEELSDVPNDELDGDDFVVKPEVTTVPQTTRCKQLHIFRSYDILIIQTVAGRRTKPIITNKVE